MTDTLARNEAAERLLLAALKDLPHVDADGVLEHGYTIRDLAFNLGESVGDVLAAEREPLLAALRALVGEWYKPDLPPNRSTMFATYMEQARALIEKYGGGG
jgi:hypothetical protein